ncbi:hypothetical protein ACF0H5_008363 [Mactra antiquata]
MLSAKTEYSKDFVNVHYTPHQSTSFSVNNLDYPVDYTSIKTILNSIFTEMESASAPRDSRDLETERCKSLIQFNIKILFPLTEYEIEQLAKVGVRYCDGVTLECVFCRSKWEWIENEDVQNIIESHTHCEHPNRMETHQNNQTESVAVIVDNQVGKVFKYCLK